MEFIHNAVWTKAADFKGYIMINNEAEQGMTKIGVFKTPASDAKYDTYYTVIY